MTGEKQETFDSEKYRRWIASLPCLITGARNVQCAHIRMNADAGMGRKPPDWRCVPLSVQQHAWQHDKGELRFWYPYAGYENAAALAKRLYELRFNTPEAVKIIEEWRRRWVHKGAVTMRHKFIDQKPEKEPENDRR